MMKNLLTLLALLISTLTFSSAQAERNFIAGEMAEGAPPELQHWGKLVGQWSVKGESLKRDGSGWQPSGDAEWDFFWAFDGWGIQDNYTQPPLSVKLEDESTRQRGTNLRIYNSKEKKWVLTWLTTTSATPSNFTAISSDSEVVMLLDGKDANGNSRRITFFAMTERSFEWKLEWSQDELSWLEVARIHGKRKK